MVDLDFAVTDVRFEPYSVAPLLLFDLAVTNNTPDVPVQNVALECQVRIEPTRRNYRDGDHERLIDLFGPPARWGETLHSFLWTHSNVSIPPFAEECGVAMPVPCNSDFNQAATKYFHGLEDGEVPLSLHFSGTIFYHDDGGRLQIERISWAKETTHRLPVSTWQAMVDHHYPHSTWLELDREAFDRLYAFKQKNGLVSFEKAIGALLAAEPGEAVQ